MGGRKASIPLTNQWQALALGQKLSAPISSPNEPQSLIGRIPRAQAPVLPAWIPCRLRCHVSEQNKNTWKEELKK
ncbi:unnamed protein product [Caretta caretta]